MSNTNNIIKIIDQDANLSKTAFFLSHQTLLNDMNLEQLLELLQLIGRPDIFCQAGGWHCSLDVHVIGKGVSFNIRSEFNLNTPRKAIKQCVERAIEALKI